jgi:hypothetical protein
LLGLARVLLLEHADAFERLVAAAQLLCLLWIRLAKCIE